MNAPGLVPYAASKSGLSHFHAGVRGELRGTGVGTTLVELGPVRAGMWDGIVVPGLASPTSRYHQVMRQDVQDEARSQGLFHECMPRLTTDRSRGCVGQGGRIRRRRRHA